jgi:hypothetical protein
MKYQAIHLFTSSPNLNIMIPQFRSFFNNKVNIKFQIATVCRYSK